MEMKEFQAQFDKKKWNDSVLWGEDRCGSYEICAFCDKKDEYPCAMADKRFKKKGVRIAIIRKRG